MEERYQEIDVMELIVVILKKWWLLAGLFIVGAVLAYGLTSKFISPIYIAQTTLFIGREPNEIAGVGISLSEFQVSEQLITDYNQIVKTRLVTEAVIRKMNLNMSVGAFTNSLTITPVGQSRLFRVGFIHNDPQLAAAVANELSEQLSIAVAEIVGVENIRIIDKALAPSYPIGPRKMMNAMVAGIMGVIIGLFIIVIRILMNNTIQKEEDIEKLIGLPVLAVIPKFKGEVRKK